jgi:hypothetical protein
MATVSYRNELLISSRGGSAPRGTGLVNTLQANYYITLPVAATARLHGSHRYLQHAVT